MSYQQWARRFPLAARELQKILAGDVEAPDAHNGKSEAWAQQQTRLKVARAGALSWRNNVGATPAKCPECKAALRPVRFGLANESQKMNKRIKSSDLILGIPRLIEPQHVGRTVLQLVGVESKRPGWRYTGNEHEAAQAAWLALLVSHGGFGKFSTGDLEL